MEIISRKEAKERGFQFYFTGKECKNGHVSERLVSNGTCCECQKQYREENRDKIAEYQKQYKKQWYQENKEYYAEYNKQWYQENREQKLEYNKQRYQANKEQRLEYSKQYREENKEQIAEYKKQYKRENKDKIVEHNKKYEKQRYHNDPLFKTKVLCRSMLRRVLKLAGTSKETTTYESLGYSNLELKTHMESLFLPGMSWDNYGDWHIDHLHPVSKFLSNGIDNPAEINALSNIAPMWAEHNLEKGDMTLDEYLTFRPELHDMYGRLISER